MDQISEPLRHEEQASATIETMARSAAMSYDPGDGYSITISRVRDLAHIEDEDEAPAPQALSSALDFLTQARQFLGQSFPQGATTIGDDGGIDVYWRRPGRTVQLMIPAGQQRLVSVYHRDGLDYGIDKGAAPQMLAYWLEWLIRA